SWITVVSSLSMRTDDCATVPPGCLVPHPGDLARHDTPAVWTVSARTKGAGPRPRPGPRNPVSPRAAVQKGNKMGKESLACIIQPRCGRSMDLDKKSRTPPPPAEPPGGLGRIAVRGRVSDGTD